MKNRMDPQPEGVKPGIHVLGRRRGLLPDPADAEDLLEEIVIGGERPDKDGGCGGLATGGKS